MEENTNKVFVGRSAATPVDPLLVAAPSTEPANTLFIINLCSSIAPVQTTGKTIPGFEGHKLYQVARAEDGRTRHRLRLGFFTSEADAEQALIAVRDNYPTAFVACLTDDDRRFARGYVPAAETTAAWKRPVLVPKPEASRSLAATPPVAAPAVATEVAIPAPAATATPTAKPVPAKTATPPPAAAAAPVIAKAAPVAAPAAGLDEAIELDWEPAIAPAATAAPTPAGSNFDTEIELSWDLPELTAPQQPATAAQPTPQTFAPVYKTDTVIKAPARPAEAARKPAAPPVEIKLTLEKEPAAATPPAAVTASNAPAQPFHVGKGVQIPASALSLEATAHHPVPAAPTRPINSKVATPTKAPKPAATNKSEPALKAPETKAAPARNGHAPELDSTQTIRALTSAELNDDSQEKWFSIQLVVSERPVNLDAMPHLDIFEAYRVYSIANAGSGKIVYSLRLGFFREEVSAEAVSGYLRTFFPSPSVIRISTAEQTRFKDAPAPRATLAQSEAKVFEINHARDRKPTIPTVTMEVSDRSPTGAFNPNATGSFKPNATGSFKPNATGSFKPGSTGSFKPNATGSFKVDASGKHKTLKPAAKAAAHATRRSAPVSKTSTSGKYKSLQKRSLQEQLLDEAREVQLSESAIRKLPKNDSLLSRLVGKLTK
ncbi:hypothetical protein [Povalibacter sp.]|uniref:hypothetical protein n=1 Tax=Povalibacter sp. TaxID=1962978 RepID=UPI002F411366